MKFASITRASCIWILHQIRVHWYNADNLGIIQELCKPPFTDSWAKGTCLAEATEASKIAVISWNNNGNHIRVYYQNPNLCLQERCYDNGQWTKGQYDKIAYAK